MPITFVGVESNISEFGGVLTIDTPAGAVEGTVLVATVSSTAPVAQPTDWVEVADVGPWESRFVAVSYYICGASIPADHDFGGPEASEQAGGITAWDGLDLVSPVDDFDSIVEDSSTSTTVVIPSVTTTEDGDLLVGTAGGTDAPSAWSVPGTMTERYDRLTSSPNRVSNVCGTEIFATTGATGTRTFTADAATKYGGVLVAFKPGCVPIHPVPLFIPFKDRLHRLARDFTDEEIARAQTHQFDNWKVVENWAEGFMADTLSPERCRLQIPYKDHARADWVDGAEQSFDNWKAVEVWAGYILDGSCGCNCGTTERLGDKCLLYIPAKDALATVDDPTDLDTLRLAADMEFDNFKALERWGNLYAAGDCGCTG